ncbi:MAG: hypothetical protein Q8936_10660 [Bacillota bacterium]|nr:hypothetical protein [Bacillota bacterium]
MKLIAESNNIKDYTAKTKIIGYDNNLIIDKCYEIEKNAVDEMHEVTKKALTHSFV